MLGDDADHAGLAGFESMPAYASSLCCMWDYTCPRRLGHAVFARTAICFNRRVQGILLKAADCGTNTGAGHKH